MTGCEWASLALRDEKNNLTSWIELFVSVNTFPSSNVLFSGLQLTRWGLGAMDLLRILCGNLRNFKSFDDSRLDGCRPWGNSIFWDKVLVIVSAWGVNVKIGWWRGAPIKMDWGMWKTASLGKKRWLGLKIEVKELIRSVRVNFKLGNDG